MSDRVVRSFRVERERNTGSSVWFSIKIIDLVTDSSAFLKRCDKPRKALGRVLSGPRNVGTSNLLAGVADETAETTDSPALVERMCNASLM